MVPDGKDPDEYIRKHGADAFRALVKEALPLVEYRLQYVLKHVNYDTLDGKVKALHEMLPVLAGIKETAVRSEYEKKLAQILLLDEGVVRDELRRYARGAVAEESAPVRAPIRQAVQQQDNAIRRAGRIIVRMVWQDVSLIHHVESVLPLAGIGDPVQREILLFLQDLSNQGQAPDDVTAAENLSEDAAAELSRALVENLGGRAETEAYNDSLKVLRKAYLNMLFVEHSRKADAYMKAGNTAYVDELNEVMKIKDEMDEL